MYLKYMGKNSTSDQRREDELNERGGWGPVIPTPSPGSINDNRTRLPDFNSKRTRQIRKQKEAYERRKRYVDLCINTKIAIALERGVLVQLITREEVIQTIKNDWKKIKKSNEILKNSHPTKRKKKKHKKKKPSNQLKRRHK